MCRLPRSPSGRSVHLIATVALRRRASIAVAWFTIPTCEQAKQSPRTTSQLWGGTSVVDRDEIRAGDILFFRIEGKMSHVGMYIGDDRFVHAPSSGKRVSIETLSSDFYRSAFIRAGRPK